MPTTIRNKKVENRGRKVKDIKGERFGHLVALEETPESTVCCKFVDKEEIGSVGATGMGSNYVEN